MSEHYVTHQDIARAKLEAVKRADERGNEYQRVVDVLMADLHASLQTNDHLRELVLELRRLNEREEAKARMHGYDLKCNRKAGV